MTQYTLFTSFGIALWRHGSQLALAGQEISEASPSSEQMRRVAELHLVLAAVRDEIGRHEVSLGHSSEKPLD